MKGQVGGFQNPGVCRQAFPSFLPLPFSPLFSRGNSLLLNPTETLATQAIYDGDVFMAYCDDSSSVPQCDINSSEAIAIQTRTLSNDDQMQDAQNTAELELEEMLDDSLIEELSNSSYEIFIGEDNNASLDSVSDSEDHDNLDMTSRQCESKPDDVLYSGAALTSSTSFVLLLTFVMKHKLTHEAFIDLLSVIEAHCPRPNNCKTSVKKLLEFASQANKDLEKHYFCDYCKAYFGKGTETATFVVKGFLKMVDSSSKYLLKSSLKCFLPVSFLFCSPKAAM